LVSGLIFFFGGGHPAGYLLSISPLLLRLRSNERNCSVNLTISMTGWKRLEATSRLR